MFIKSLHLGLIGLFLCAASAWAGNSALQGVVKDPKGKPIKAADIRIEARDGSKVLKTVKTDATGRYISDGLPVGTYRVTLIVNGAIKASINNTETKLGAPTELNFDLKPASASQASGSAKKAKHMVWMPAQTGTHLGGRWVEVYDNGNAATIGADNVQKVDGSAVTQLQGRAYSAPSAGGGH
jgi:Carboxypeptidase regulatory-like domain